MVVLGGSNVSRGISIIVETARQIVGSPVDFFIAMGHGRSYGMRSRLMGRGLPGIKESGLWDALDADGSPETFALVTDVGNDVAYGAPVPEISRWVEWCLMRLTRRNANVVMTALPMCTLERLSPLHFYLTKTIFFPFRPIDMDKALGRAAELDKGLQVLGQAHGAHLADQDPAWYGLDPIHIRMRDLPAAWGRILSPWNGGRGPAEPARASVSRWLRLRLQTPPQWWLFGLKLGRVQPFRRLPDGSTVSFY